MYKLLQILIYFSNFTNKNTSIIKLSNCVSLFTHKWQNKHMYKVETVSFLPFIQIEDFR